MDKSEGKNFLSKTFGSVTEKVAKWYHAGNMKLSISSLKRARSEKIHALGNKVLEILEQGKNLTTETLKAEFKSIKDLDTEIKLAEADLAKLQLAEDGKTSKKQAAKKTTPPETASTKKTAPKKTAASAKTTAKKSKEAKTKKATSAKPATKKTGDLPMVKQKSTPAVKSKATPAVKPETEIMAKDEK